VLDAQVRQKNSEEIKCMPRGSSQMAAIAHGPGDTEDDAGVRECEILAEADGTLCTARRLEYPVQPDW